MAADPAARDRYVVTGKVAILQTHTPDGVRLRYFYAGAPVPDDVPDHQIEHHLRVGLIAKAGDEAAKAGTKGG